MISKPKLTGENETTMPSHWYGWLLSVPSIMESTCGEWTQAMGAGLRVPNPWHLLSTAWKSSLLLLARWFNFRFDFHSKSSVLQPPAPVFCQRDITHPSTPAPPPHAYTIHLSHCVCWQSLPGTGSVCLCCSTFLFFFPHDTASTKLTWFPTSHIHSSPLSLSTTPISFLLYFA